MPRVGFVKNDCGVLKGQNISKGYIFHSVTSPKNESKNESKNVHKVVHIDYGNMGYGDFKQGVQN